MTNDHSTPLHHLVNIWFARHCRNFRTNRENSLWGDEKRFNKCTYILIARSLVAHHGSARWSSVVFFKTCVFSSSWVRNFIFYHVDSHESSFHTHRCDLSFHTSWNTDLIDRFTRIICLTIYLTPSSWLSSRTIRQPGWILWHAHRSSCLWPRVGLRMTKCARGRLDSISHDHFRARDNTVSLTFSSGTGP